MILPVLVDLVTKPIFASNELIAFAESFVPRMRLTCETRNETTFCFGGNVFSLTSVPLACTTSFGHDSRNRAANLPTAASIPYGSTPRSKRNDASDRRPRRVAVLATPDGSKNAVSSATTEVVALISVLAPPITPAKPIGISLPSQINKSVIASSRV